MCSTKKSTKDNVSFERWLKTLKKMAVNNYGFTIPYNSWDAWQEYYDDGMTPREALDEDTYAGI